MGEPRRRITGHRRASVAAGILTAIAIPALVAPTARADIISGLAARYDFNSAAAVGADTSGNANNGTLSPTNAAFFNDPTRGGVLKLTPSGGPGYLLVPDSVSLSITGDITLAAFVNLADYNNFNGIIGKTQSNQPASYDLYTVQNTGVPRFFRGNGLGLNGVSDAIGPISTGQWHFYAVTMSGNSVSHFLDGALTNFGTISTTLGDTDAPLYIGSRADLVTAFNGSIDAVRIYNRALSAADVAELYSSVTPEPAGAALALIGAAAAAVRRRRRSR